MSKSGLLVACFLLFSVNLAAEADDIRFSAELDRSEVPLGQGAYLHLKFEGSRDVERPDVSVPDGLAIRYVGPSTRMSIVNGQVTQSVTHIYLVRPEREGEYVLGPFSVRYGRHEHAAESVRLKVTAAAPTDAPSQRAPGEEALYDSDALFLQLEVPKRTVYVNEAIWVYVKLYAHDVALENIRYPVLAHDGFSAGSMEAPERFAEVIGGRDYRVFSFRARLFAETPGEYVLGPARLNCTVLARRSRARRPGLFGGFFDDDLFGTSLVAHPVELSSLSVPVTILPLPDEGRPGTFRGAVGRFDIRVSLTDDVVEVGDPVILRMEIEGAGDMDTVTMPEVSVPEGFRTYDPQVDQQEHRKVYEQIIVPRSVEANEISEVVFSYFDPEEERYVEVRKGPFILEVHPPEERSPVDMTFALPDERRLREEAPAVREDVLHIKTSPGRFRESFPRAWRSVRFWSVQASGVTLFVLFNMYWYRRRKLRTDSSFARMADASRRGRKCLRRAREDLAGGRLDAFYDDLHRALAEYFFGKMGIPPGAVNAEELAEHLTGKGCPDDVIAVCRDILSECETARYASLVPDRAKAAALLAEAERILSKLERKRI